MFFSKSVKKEIENLNHIAIFSLLFLNLDISVIIKGVELNCSVCNPYIYILLKASASQGGSCAHFRCQF